MNEATIVSEYRQAKNKGAQIGILAELYAVPRAKIIEILETAGEVVACSRGGKRQWSEEDKTKLQEMAEAGEPLETIMQALHRSPRAVEQMASFMGVKIKKEKKRVVEKVQHDAQPQEQEAVEGVRILRIQPCDPMPVIGQAARQSSETQQTQKVSLAIELEIELHVKVVMK